MKQITCINIMGLKSYIKKIDLKSRKIVFDKTFYLKDPKEQKQMKKVFNKVFSHEDISCIDNLNIYYPHPGPDSNVICGKKSLLLANKSGMKFLDSNDKNLIIRNKDKYYKKISKKSGTEIFSRDLDLDDIKLLKEFRELMLKPNITEEEIIYLSELVNNIFLKGMYEGVKIKR